MIVSRLKRGWRIHLSDSEMELIRLALHQGMLTLQETNPDDHLIRSMPPQVRRVLHSDRWSRVPGGPLVLDVDRRG